METISPPPLLPSGNSPTVRGHRSALQHPSMAPSGIGAFREDPPQSEPMEYVLVAASASDPIALAGLTEYLRGQPAIRMVQPAMNKHAAVHVVAVERITPAVVASLRHTASTSDSVFILMATQVSPADLETLDGCRVVAVVERQAFIAGHLVESIIAADSADVFQQDLHEMGVLPTSAAPTCTVLTDREIKILRLVAKGRETGQIAEELCYSERTVKNALYAISRRLSLRNRAHAVAYVIRANLI